MKPKQQSHAVAPTQRPSMVNIGWIIGLYEGEGNCWAANGHLTLRIGQNDPEILYRAQDLFGGSVHCYKKSRTDPDGKPRARPGSTFMWVLCGPRARGLAMTMYGELSAARRFKLRSGLVRTRQKSLPFDGGSA